MNEQTKELKSMHSTLRYILFVISIIIGVMVVGLLQGCSTSITRTETDQNGIVTTTTVKIPTSGKTADEFILDRYGFYKLTIKNYAEDSNIAIVNSAVNAGVTAAGNIIRGQ